MHNKHRIKFLLIVSLLLIAGMACSVFSGLKDAAGVAETAGAAITEAGSGLETVQAMVTQSGIAETAQALVTQGGIQETVQALATDLPLPTLTGEKPADIPVMDGDLTAEIMSEKFISYVIDAVFQDVIDFYEREMPANGWTKDEANSSTNQGFTTLAFTKDSRKATVIITEVPFLNQTSVSINIE